MFEIQLEHWAAQVCSATNWLGKGFWGEGQHLVIRAGGIRSRLQIGADNGGNPALRRVENGGNHERFRLTSCVNESNSILS